MPTWKNPYPVASSAGPAADLKSLTSKTYPWTPPTGASGGSRLNPDGTIKPIWGGTGAAAFDTTGKGAYDGMPSLKNLTGGSTNSWDWNQSNPMGVNYVPGSNASTTPKTDTTTYINAMGPGEAKVEVTDYPIDTTKYINDMGPGEPKVEITDAPSAEPPTVPNNKGDGQLTIDKNTGNIYRGYEFIGTLPGYENVMPTLKDVVQPSEPQVSSPPVRSELNSMQAAPWGPSLVDFVESPGYKFRLQQGIDAILASASARGHLRSTGTEKQIMEYAQGLAAQEWDNYFNQYDKNRTFAANRYDTSFNQDWIQKYFDADIWKYMTDKEFDNFWKSNASYDLKMAAKEARDSALASVGPNAAGKGVDLAAATATALANLSTALASWQAMAAQGKGESAGGGLDAIIGAITSLVGSLGNK